MRTRGSSPVGVTDETLERVGSIYILSKRKIIDPTDRSKKSGLGCSGEKISPAQQSRRSAEETMARDCVPTNIVAGRGSDGKKHKLLLPR